MELSVIIIDDEIDAIEAIENILITRAEKIKILAKTNDPEEAVQLIIKLKPDLIFLDIEMPRMDGFELIGKLPLIDFEIIFVTAYESYAIKAIKENAIDYILKPVNIGEVLNAIDKARIRINTTKSNVFQYEKIVEAFKQTQLKRIKIPTANGYEFVISDNVVRLEASGSYTYAMLLDGGKLIISKSIKEVEYSFQSVDFFRIHRSHIINLQHIKRFLTENDGEIVMVDDSRVPLSRRRRKEFNNIIKERF